MRKFTYLFILLIIASYPVKSQTINNSNDLAGGWVKYPPVDENYIDGTRNLYDDFRRGTVYYINSVDLNVPLRLNLHNDEFEYIKNDTLYILENLAHLEKVELEGQVFIYQEPNSETHVSGFMIRWNTKLPAVMTKMKVSFHPKEFVAFGYKQKRFEREEDRHYLMNSELEFVRITSVKKLINLLDSHTSELKRYAKAEKISGRNPAEMAKILDYYQKIGQDL